MARIRSVKPEFWVDRSFVRKVPNRDARMLYMALWNLADEHARLMGDPAYIKGQAFPYAEDDDLTPKVIDELLDMLADAERVVRYEVDGDPYLFLPRLAKHQRLESAKVPSRLPPPPDPDEPAPRPDKSAPGPDGAAPDAVLPSSQANTQVIQSSEVGADKSARDSDESARGADTSALLYVAGCMEQVAGSRDCAEPGTLFDPPAVVATAPSAREDQSAKEPDAGTLLAEWLEFCGSERPTDRIIGRVGKRVKEILAQGIAYATVRHALAKWARSGKDPSAIDSFVNEVQAELRANVAHRVSSAIPAVSDDATVISFQDYASRQQIPGQRVSATARAIAEADRAGEEAKRLIYGSAG